MNHSNCCQKGKRLELVISVGTMSTMPWTIWTLKLPYAWIISVEAENPRDLPHSGGDSKVILYSKKLWREKYFGES